jgi:hypothetical protein
VAFSCRERRDPGPLGSSGETVGTASRRASGPMVSREFGALRPTRKVYEACIGAPTLLLGKAVSKYSPTDFTRAVKDRVASAELISRHSREFEPESMQLDICFQDRHATARTTAMDGSPLARGVLVFCLLLVGAAICSAFNAAFTCAAGHNAFRAGQVPTISSHSKCNGQNGFS